jgi:TusA-related sulfurtransferase
MFLRAQTRPGETSTVARKPLSGLNRIRIVTSPGDDWQGAKGGFEIHHMRCYRRHVAASRDSTDPSVCDLRGVPCPLNWARAKTRLEAMKRGEKLLIVTDAPRAERDVPAAAETEGWAVLEVLRTDSEIRILIER